MRSATLGTVLLALAGVLGFGCVAVRGVPAPSGFGPVEFSRGYDGPEVRAAFGFFYDDLAPHGYFYWLDDYGWSWCPTGLEYGWRPYTHGSWAYSSSGWLWVSGYSWGWGPFHYGRWLDDPVCGWVWIPGDEWGPAWVAWRHGAGWYGWAPLPPRVTWQGDHDWDRIVPRYGWSFVDRDHFLDARVDRYLAPRGRAPTLLGLTRNATRFDRGPAGIRNLGPDVDVVERELGRRIERHRIVTTRDRGPVRQERDRVVVFRPFEEGGPPDHRIARPQEQRLQRGPRAEDVRQPPRAGEPQRFRAQPQIEQRELKRLQQLQSREEARLQQEQRARLRRRPDGRRPDEVQGEQQQEMRLLRERHAEERQQLERRRRRDGEIARDRPERDEREESDESRGRRGRGGNRR